MTAINPPASLKPNHITARKTISMVGMVSIKGMTASRARSTSRLRPMKRPIAMPTSIEAAKAAKIRAKVSAMWKVAECPVGPGSTKSSAMVTAMAPGAGNTSGSCISFAAIHQRNSKMTTDPARKPTPLALRVIVLSLPAR
jgi:hypothetical protein